MFSHSPSKCPWLAEADVSLDPLVETPGIDQDTFEEAFKRDFEGQHDFQIIWRVEGVFVMFLMAGPKHHRVEAAEKAEDVEEERVQPLRFEDSAMTKLVEAVEQEGVKGAMHE